MCFFCIFVLSFSNSLLSQPIGKGRIIYSISPEIDSIITKELSLNKIRYDTSFFIPSILMDIKDENINLHLLSRTREVGKNYKLDSLVILTNRFIFLKCGLYLPIVFYSDLSFSQFSHSLLGRSFRIYYNKETSKVHYKGWN